MRRTIIRSLAILAAGVASAGAYAAPIVCNTPVVGLRILTITPNDAAVTGSCFSTGTGNLSDPQLLNAIGGGATFIERDEADSNAGSLFISGINSQTNGTWSFTGGGPVTYLYFKFGTQGSPPGTNPDWFIFALNTGATSGTWTAGGQSQGATWGGLSSVASARGVAVPEPGMVGLLGLGIMAMGFARRRKKA